MGAELVHSLLLATRAVVATGALVQCNATGAWTLAYGPRHWRARAVATRAVVATGAWTLAYGRRARAVQRHWRPVQSLPMD